MSTTLPLFPVSFRKTDGSTWTRRAERARTRDGVDVARFEDGDGRAAWFSEGCSVAAGSDIDPATVRVTNARVEAALVAWTREHGATYAEAVSAVAGNPERVERYAGGAS